MRLTYVASRSLYTCEQKMGKGENLGRIAVDFQHVTSPMINVGQSHFSNNCHSISWHPTLILHLFFLHVNLELRSAVSETVLQTSYSEL